MVAWDLTAKPQAMFSLGDPPLLREGWLLLNAVHTQIPLTGTGMVMLSKALARTAAQRVPAVVGGGAVVRVGGAILGLQVVLQGTRVLGDESRSRPTKRALLPQSGLRGQAITYNAVNLMLHDCPGPS